MNNVSTKTGVKSSVKTILLVRPKPDKESIGLRSFMICEPLELEYLSSYLEHDGHNVHILDMILEKKEIGYFIKKYKPDIVGFTSYIIHVKIVKEYARLVKKISPDIFTVVGGVHAEVVPQDFVDKSMDFIVHVNGLKTFKQIMRSLHLGVVFIKKQVPGIWDGPDKKYIIEKKFDFPFPDRTKTDKYRKNYNYVFHSQCATLKTSFGCVYNCQFCFCIKITRHNYFERDLDNVIEEIKVIKEQNIFIVDDNFLYNKERVLMFINLLKKHKIRKHYILFGRSDFIIKNEDIISRFKKVGLQAVFMGLESFNQVDLNNMNKRILVEDNVRAIRILEKYDIECYAGIIIGQDWIKADFKHLIQWLNRFDRVFVNIQPLTPIPGTPVYEKLKNDLCVPRAAFKKWDMAHIVVQPVTLSLRQFYWNILKAYYKTSTSVRAHLYIFKKYGLRMYIRSCWGSLYITWQYLMMILRG